MKNKNKKQQKLIHAQTNIMRDVKSQLFGRIVFGPIELYAQFYFFLSRCTATDKINYSEKGGERGWSQDLTSFIKNDSVERGQSN